MASAVLNAEQFEDRRDDQLGYAGNISAQEAWDLVSSDANAQLIDVRTSAEWAFVGAPNISSLNKQTIGLAWKMWPTMEVNANFMRDLEIAIANKDAPICFICKTGGRSLDAAIEATRNGYKHAFNVEHGFEGDKDHSGHRGTHNGWKATGLPWEQQ